MKKIRYSLLILLWILLGYAFPIVAQTAPMIEVPFFEEKTYLASNQQEVKTGEQAVFTTQGVIWRLQQTNTREYEIANTTSSTPLALEKGLRALKNHLDQPYSPFLFIFLQGAIPPGAVLDSLLNTTHLTPLTCPWSRIQSNKNLSSLVNEGFQLFLITDTNSSHQVSKKLISQTALPMVKTQNLFPLFNAPSFLKTNHKGYYFQPQPEQPLLPDSLHTTYDFPSQKRFKDLSPSSWKLLKEILFFWIRTGKVPAFVESSPTMAHENRKAIEIINKQKRLSGYFSYKEKPMGPVNWVERPLSFVYGYYSIPFFTTQRQHFTPRKAGYRFLPDIIYYTEENQDYCKNFQSLPLDKEEGLVALFNFQKGVKNLAPSHSPATITPGVSFIKDPERGKCANFTGGFIDYGDNPALSFNEGISIAAWIKPEINSNNLSIAGKGMDFSFKVRFGHLTFTTAEIKDHIPQEARIEAGKWQHIAITFAPERVTRFYINGKLVAEQAASRMKSSSRHLIIGNNLWDEAYQGLLDDVFIWNREITTAEIQAIYQKEEKSHSLQWWWVASLLIPLGVWSGFRIHRKHSKKEQKNQVIPKVTEIKEETTLPNTTSSTTINISTFGGFSIKNEEEEELVHTLAPKLRHLFLVVLWHTYDQEKGISSKGLNELLWPGLPSERAKNNRSTQMQRLRQALRSIPGLECAYTQKRWHLVVPTEANCDLREFFQLSKELPNNYTSSSLNTFIDLLKSGPFLPEQEDSSLDAIKGKISNQILDTLTCDTSIKVLKEDPIKALQVTRIVNYYDSLNEVALDLEIHALSQEGKHSLAHDTYDRFCKNYRELYQEPFKRSFLEILNNLQKDKIG